MELNQNVSLKKLLEEGIKLKSSSDPNSQKNENKNGRRKRKFSDEDLGNQSLPKRKRSEKNPVSSGLLRAGAVPLDNEADFGDMTLASLLRDSIKKNKLKDDMKDVKKSLRRDTPLSRGYSGTLSSDDIILALAAPVKQSDEPEGNCLLHWKNRKPRRQLSSCKNRGVVEAEGGVCNEEAVSSQLGVQKTDSLLSLLGKLGAKRKREQGCPKRRYKEVRYDEINPYKILDRRIKVFWPLDSRWYYGSVDSYDDVNKLHYVRYDDHDEEWLSLQNEKFKLEVVRSRPIVSGSCVGVNENEVLADASKKFRGRNKGCSSLVKEGEVSKKRSFSAGNDRVRKAFLAARSLEHDAKVRNVYVRKRFRKMEENVRPRTERLMRRAWKKSDSATMQPEESIRTAEDSESRGSGLMFPEASMNIIKNHQLMIVFPEGLWTEIFVVPEVTFMECDFQQSASGDACIAAAKFPCSTTLSNSILECQMLSGFLFVSYMKFCKYFIVSGFTIHGFICSEEFCKEGSLLLFCNSLICVFPGMGREDVSCHSNLVVKQCQSVACVWPDVLLDIRLVDELLDSVMLSVETCLWEVLEGFMKIMLSCTGLSNNICSFCDFGQQKINECKMSTQSVAFQISVSQNFRRSFGFILHGLQGYQSSDWLKFRRNLFVVCLLLNNSPLTRPNNSLFLPSATDAVDILSDLKPLSSLQASNLFRPNKLSISPNGAVSAINRLCKETGICWDSVSVLDFDIGCLSSQLYRYVSLKFALAPTSFLGLYNKMLHGQDGECLNSQRERNKLQGRQNKVPNTVSSSEELEELFLSKVKGVEDESRGTDADAAQTVFNDSFHRPVQVLPTGARWVARQTLKVDVDVPPASTDDHWVISSPPSSNSELSLNATPAGLESNQEKFDTMVSGNILKLRRCATGKGSWRFSRASISSFDTHQNSSVHQFEGASYSNHGINNEEDISVTDVNDGRDDFVDSFSSHASVWEPNRKSVSQSPSWSKHKARSFCNGITEPKKKRTGCLNTTLNQKSSQPTKGYGRRGRPSRQQQEERLKKSMEENMRKSMQEKMKKSTNNSADLKTTSNSPSHCIANILISNEERGWRECGAHVVHETLEQGEWTLAVKVSGVTRFTYKPQSAIQPFQLNRFTHAMMWRGAPEWSLEFTHKKQWFIFKDLYEECQHRNVRLASVRQIPIPGVRVIEDYDRGTGIHFVRPSSRYIRQLENEVETALASTHVTYDMDSEDEEWLDRVNSSRSDNGEGQPTEVSEETFERIMDLLEKTAFTQQRELLNRGEVADFCWDIASVEVVKAIHDHWQEKRWRKGMALIRQFQPACWERYQQQLRDWESHMQEIQISPRTNKQEINLEKPQMFAFCLKPKGLKVRNKTQKQKSHRKFNFQQMTSRDHDIGAFSLNRKNGCSSIVEETSSDATVSAPCSSPSQAEIYSHPEKSSAGCLEAVPHIDFCESRLKPQNQECQHRESWNIDQRKPKKQKTLVSSLPLQEHNAAVQSDLERGKKYPHVLDASYSDQFSDTSYPLPFTNISGVNSRCAPEVTSFEAEARVKEAANATKAATEVAAYKRARALRLMHKADLIIYKARVALVSGEVVHDVNTDSKEAGSIASENRNVDASQVSRQKLVTGSGPLMNMCSTNDVCDITDQDAFTPLDHWKLSTNTFFNNKCESEEIQHLGRPTTVSLASASHCLKEQQDLIFSQPKISSGVQHGSSNQFPKPGLGDPFASFSGWGSKINT